MIRLYTRFQAWQASDEGATAVEYGILVAAIAAAIVVIVGTLGLKVDNAFDKVIANMK
jgi:pilus assembly protein Flp/PilA